MIGSASPAIKKHILKAGAWVAVHKLRSLFSEHPYSMYENSLVRDYRDGKIKKDELDRLSTCERM